MQPLTPVDPISLASNLPLPSLLKQAELQGALSPLDRHFALQMAELGQSDAPWLLLVLALLSKQLSAQHSCLPLAHIDSNNPLGLAPSQQDSPCHCAFMAAQAELAPRLQQALASSALVWNADNATAEDSRPLVLQQGRLYLRRYWRYEQQVAQQIRQRASDSQVALALDSDPQLLKLTHDLLLQLFPASQNATDSHNVDWQKVAAATALTRQLAVITGGPGTGKTTTVTKVLLLLLQLLPALKIRLVAPTGKAAARLSESIKGTKVALQRQLGAQQSALQQALNLIPEEAATVHRLLGVIPGSNRFRHHQDNPLLLDLLIVDEASMVDLPLMAKLLQALPAQARLILLGDQDQLASVEAGAVLADICQGLQQGPAPWQMRYGARQAARLNQLCELSFTAATQQSGLGDSLCLLRHSHRFQGDAGIGLLAAAVNQGDTQAINAIWQHGYHELQWLEYQLDGSAVAALMQRCLQGYQGYLKLIQQGAEPSQVLAAFNQFRVLCALRSGAYGVEGINQAIIHKLATDGVLAPTTEFYAGRPLIIQSNDYNLGLFNGDIGLVLPDPSAAQRLMAWFERADGTLLKVLPARLPRHESCFAMTVHKSQGSEFTHVALVLPPEPRGPQQQLLCRELLYTAITRAKQQFICLASRQVFVAASACLTRRASGLASQLWQQ